MTYASSDLLSHDDIQLTQEGMILIGVLRGGDYSDGLHGCGVATAHGLAKAGFGEKLVRAARTLSRDALEDFLVDWRQEIRHELRTNSSGKLGRKSPSLAKAITEDFPSIDVVLAYTNPITSEAKGPGHKNTIVDWDKEPDLGRIAGLCEMYFEWGIKHIIIKRFRTVLWPSAVLRILRRAAIIKDRKAAAINARSRVPETPTKNGKERRAPPGTPSRMITEHFARITLNTPHRNPESELESDDDDEHGERLIVKIHSSRRHPSTDNVLEYRLEIAPAQLVRLCEAGIKGLRHEVPPDLSDSDDDGDDDEGEGRKGGKKSKKSPPDPESHLRIWLPACMVEIVEPDLVEEFEGVRQKKAEKKAGRGAGAATKKSAGAAKTKKIKAPVLEEEEGSSASDVDSPPVDRSTTKGSLIPEKRRDIPKAATELSVDKAVPAVGSSTTNTLLAARKPTATAHTKTARTVSTTSRVADLFKDSLSLDGPPRFTVEESSDSDDEASRHFDPSRVTAHPAHSTSATNKISTSASTTSRGPSSRLLSLLDTQAVAGPSARPSKATITPSSASPLRQRVIRPFPMDLNPFLAEKPTSPAGADEDMYTSARSGLSSNSSPPPARPRSRLTSSSGSDSDAPSRMRQLQKSPRGSQGQSLPRSTPTHVQRMPRKEEEEESSDDGARRPPSPSPFKGRYPTSLSTSTHRIKAATSTRVDEEFDRALSPSPPRRRKALSTLVSNAAPRPPANRKQAPLPADLSIISISSDSETDAPAPAKPVKLNPLQLARSRLASTNSSSAKPPQRKYDPKDVIDLT